MTRRGASGFTYLEMLATCGILMILVFAVTLGWLPPSSTGGIDHLVMPSVALGLLSMATFARVTRTALLEELSA